MRWYWKIERNDETRYSEDCWRTKREARAALAEFLLEHVRDA
jgi:hypothetical protein